MSALHDLRNTRLDIAPGDPQAPAAAGDWEQEVLRQLRQVRFGQVSFQVHDGRIVQIERTERTRFDPPATSH
jgi:hypothetical protein